MNDSSGNRTAATALLIALACVAGLRLVTLGAYPLFDDTEARYALIGQVMVQSGNWITPQLSVGEPFWAKPPLSMWGTAASLAVFGMNEFAARLPSFLFVALAGFLVYVLGAAWRDRQTGLLATLVFAGTALTFYLAGGVMTDPPLVLGITLTMAAYWRAMNGASRSWGYLFFVGVAVSALAKGPIGVVLPGLAIFAWMLWQRRWRDTWERLPWISGTLLAAALTVPWYVAAEIATPGFLRYFIVGEHFERFTSMGWTGDLYGRPRRHPHGTIWVLGIAAMLPWSLLALASPFVRSLRDAVFSREMIRDPWLSFLVIWHLTPLVFFTVPRGVLITYVAMSLPAFALLVAHVLTRLSADPSSAHSRASGNPGAPSSEALGPRLRGDERGGRGSALRVTIATAAVVPLLALALALSLRIEAVAERLPNQANIVAAFEEQRRTPDATLTYVGRRPFSARFYSEGRAGLAATPEDMARLMADGTERFFALPRARFERLPEALRARFSEVAADAGTVLVQTR